MKLPFLVSLADEVRQVVHQPFDQERDYLEISWKSTMPVHEESIFFFSIILNHINHKKVQNKCNDNKIGHLEIIFIHKLW
jgi:hypothetical protein